MKNHALPRGIVSGIIQKILFCSALFLPNTSVAQNPEMDSLKLVVKESIYTGTLSDSGAFRAYTELSKHALNIQEFDTAFKYASQGIELLEKLNEKEADHPFAIKELALNYRRKAIAQQYMGEYVESLSTLQHFETLSTKLGNKKWLGKCYQMMSACFRETNDTKRALEYSRKSISILQTIDPGIELAEAYMGQGGIEQQLPENDSAYYSYKAAAEIFQHMQNSNKEGAVYLNLVEMYVNDGIIDSANVYMKKARIVEPLWTHGVGRAQYLGMKAKVLTIQNDFSEARKALSEALLFTDDDPDNLSQLYHLKALAEAGCGQGDSAYAFLKAGNDQLIASQNADKVREITETQLNYEHQNELALSELKLNNEKLKKRNALIGLGLVLALMALLILLIVKSRQNSRLLQAKNEEILNTRDQLVATEKQREAEQVRTQISRDIHDELGGDLTKISLLASEIARRVKEDPESSLTFLQDLGRISREANAALKDIVWSVDPEQDTWQGLVNHAEIYTHRILDSNEHEKQLRFEFNGPQTSLDPATKQNIFLVLKEALNNAVKHAQATLIKVHLITTTSGYSLAIQDNGVGIPEYSKSTASHGLKNMKSRADVLHATLIVKSDKSGTEIELSGNISG